MKCIKKLLQAYTLLSHKDYILPHISIKFRMVVAKSSSYAVVKTARESQQLNLTYGR